MPTSPRELQYLDFSFILGQHRAIRQEQSAKDFSSDESSESGGILCVFPTFRTAQSAEKIRCLPQANCAVLP